MFGITKIFNKLAIGDKITISSDGSCRAFSFEIAALDVSEGQENRWVASSKGDKFYEKNGHTVRFSRDEEEVA